MFMIDIWLAGLAWHAASLAYLTLSLSHFTGLHSTVGQMKRLAYTRPGLVYSRCSPDYAILVFFPGIYVGWYCSTSARP